MIAIRNKMKVTTSCPSCNMSNTVDFSEFVDGTRTEHKCKCGYKLIEDDAFKTLVAIRSILNSD